MQAPVGVRLIELAVGTYHFGLEPYTEFQTYLVDLIYKVLQSALYLLLIDEPVSEGGTVVVPVSEPAVVHHEHLYARLLCFSRDIEQLLGVEVEVCSLPVVDKYGAADILPLAADKVTAHYIMEVPGHLPETLGGVGDDDLGGLEAFAVFEVPGEVVGVLAYDDAGLFVLIDLSHSEERARPA